MSDIKIQNDTEGAITYSEATTHDEKSLILKYRNEGMAAQVQTAMIEQTPQALSEIQMHIEISNISVQMNDEKQTKFKKIFEDLEINIPKRIEKLKGKYSDMDLFEKAKKLNEETEIEFVKVGDKFEMITKVTQSTEDMLISFMSLQDAKPGMIERLLNQTKELDMKVNQRERAQKLLDEIKDRMRKIEAFFKTQGKDINKLLDQESATRTKAEKTAKDLPANGK